MYPNREDGWKRIELMLLRLYLLFHISSSVFEMIMRKLHEIHEIGHNLAIW